MLIILLDQKLKIGISQIMKIVKQWRIQTKNIDNDKTKNGCNNSSENQR